MRRFYKDDLIGPYRIIRLFGKGGMGCVYEVEHQKLGVRYALKTFTLEHGSVILLRKRFLAEGKVLARLRHPNLVRVYDLDYDLTTGTPYFTMDEILNGEGKPQTLGEANPGCVDEETLVKWFRQLASALDYIHAKGIVHRDVKPSNILIDASGSVMLTDFGVARYIDDELRKDLSVTTRFARSKITHDTMKMVIGTRQFMSPEVKSGAAASVTADDYSLGMVFFWLLTGVWYRGEESQFEMLKNFDYDWWSVLPWLMNKQPGMRPPTIAEAVSLLQPKPAPEPIEEPEAEAAIDDSPSTPSPNNESTEKEELTSKPQPVPLGRKDAGMPLWGVAVVCGVMIGIVQIFENPCSAPGYRFIVFIVAAIPFSMVVRTTWKWLRRIRKPADGTATIGQQEVPHGKFLDCPFCHATMELAAISSDGQHIRCPYCDGKSQYDGKSDSLIDINVVVPFEPFASKAKKPIGNAFGRAQNIQPLSGTSKPVRIELPNVGGRGVDDPEVRKVQRIDPLSGISQLRHPDPGINVTIRAKRVVAARSQFLASAADKNNIPPHEDHYHPEEWLSMGLAAKFQRISPNSKIEKRRQAAIDAFKARPAKKLSFREDWLEFWERLKHFPDSHPSAWKICVALAQFTRKTKQNHGATIRKIAIRIFIGFVALCSGLSVYFSIAGRDIEAPYLGDLYPQPITKRVPDDQNIIPLLKAAVEAINDKSIFSIKKYRNGHWGNSENILGQYLRRDEIGGRYPTSRIVRTKGIEQWADKLLSENEKFFKILDKAATLPFSQYPVELEWGVNDARGRYYEAAWGQERFDDYTGLRYSHGYSPDLAVLRVQRLRELGESAEAIKYAILYGNMFAQFEFEAVNRLPHNGRWLTSHFECELLKIVAEEKVTDEMLLQIDAALSRWSEMRINSYRRELRCIVLAARHGCCLGHYYYGCPPAITQFLINWFAFSIPGWRHYCHQPNRTLRDIANVVRELDKPNDIRKIKDVENQYPTLVPMRLKVWASLPIRRNMQGILTMNDAGHGIGIWHYISWQRFNGVANHVVIAASRYKHKHGTYPSSLRELVPEFLEKVPQDPCAQRPISYNAEQHIIYSCGPLGEFDGTVKTTSDVLWHKDGSINDLYVRRIDGRTLPFLTPLPE